MKALQSGHIVLSETGWTDNELGLAWLKNCFDPETLWYDDNGKRRSRILIFDGHASHISTEAICFCIQAEIIALCLPQHSTHLLQSLNIGVFSSYTYYYKKKLLKYCCFNTHYLVNKIIFLKILQNTQAQALIKKIILKA